MTIQQEVKGQLWDKEISKRRREILQVIYGEFSRVNDGKEIDDKEATQVLKKMIKGLDNTMSFVTDAMKLAMLRQEKGVCGEFLNTADIAGDDMMYKAIEASVPPGTKNKMACMKPCIHYLEDKGYEVDKRRLSELLRG